MEQTATAGLTVDQVVEVTRTAIGRIRSQDVEIAPDTRFRDLGLDSLEIAEIFLELEDVAGVELDQQSAEGVEVVSDLVRLRPS
jgi:acyl carrier protein